MKFSVVDVETTGLFAKKHDRIIEIAIVQVDESGGTPREYSTLVNPQRDIGPTRIHSICSRDVLDAPIFDDTAGSIVELLKDAVFVAHNAYFDESFVRSEFQRIQHPLPPFPTLCTMMLSSDAGCAAGSRRLDDLCCYFGIEHQEAHSALGDARATAHLLLRLMGTVPGGSRIRFEKVGG